MNPLPYLLTLAVISSPALIAAADESSPAASTTAANPDLLRFANHDTLHGSFIAFAPQDTIQWQNSESPDPISFHSKNIQRIVINNGNARSSLPYQSAIHLVNGDVVPGKIISANQESVTIESDLLGKLTIARNHITSLSTTPFAGKLLYFGPLNTKGWRTLSSDHHKKTDKEKPKEKEKVKEDEKPEDEKDTDWKHVANAWYAGSDKSKFLILDDALPDQCKLAFKLSWRGTLYANIIFHADFSPPECKEKDNNRSIRGLGTAPGHAYVLSFTSHSASLSSLTYDEKGKVQSNRFDETRASLGLSGKDSAQFELRLDRINKSILLFSDGVFRAKWSLGDDYHGKGDKLAFIRNVSYNNAELKVSDITIANWNGLKDSAQSMSSTNRDVILLNNGLDRFSGRLESIRDDKVHFQGAYNNKLLMPVSDVQDITFATKEQMTKPETDQQAVYFYVYPYGRITGIPTESHDGKTKIITKLLGEITLDVNYINIIDFSHKNSLLELWDDNF